MSEFIFLLILLLSVPGTGKGRLILDYLDLHFGQCLNYCNYLKGTKRKGP